MAFMGNIEYKKYHKAVWNSMTRDYQMQVRKLHEQQGIKPTVKQTSAEARIAALDAWLRIHSQPKEGDVTKKKEEGPKEPVCGSNMNPVVTCRALGGKHKEPS